MFGSPSPSTRVYRRVRVSPPVPASPGPYTGPTMADLPRDTDDLVRRALAEDLGAGGDVTSRASLPPGLDAHARVEARAEGVLAGLPVAERVIHAVDAAVRFRARRSDGDRLVPGEVVASLEGSARSILAAER